MKPLPEGKTGQHAGRNLSFAGTEPHADEDIEEGDWDGYGNNDDTHSLASLNSRPSDRDDPSESTSIEMGE